MSSPDHLSIPSMSPPYHLHATPHHLHPISPHLHVISAAPPRHLHFIFDHLHVISMSSPCLLHIISASPPHHLPLPSALTAITFLNYIQKNHCLDGTKSCKSVAVGLNLEVTRRYAVSMRVCT